MFNLIFSYLFKEVLTVFIFYFISLIELNVEGINHTYVLPGIYEQYRVDVRKIKNVQEKEFGDSYSDRSYMNVSGTAIAVMYMGQKVQRLKSSPEKNKIGFFIETQLWNSGSDVALFIYYPEKELVKLVYKGSHRTSYWKWIDNDTIEVAYGCGTQCLYAFIIDANTGKQKGGYFLVQ